MPVDEIRTLLDHFIGLQGGATSLTLLQVSVRAGLVYLLGYFLLRVGEHRFVGKNTAFDVVLGFIFGATLSRAINGSAPFFDTVVAGLILLGLHYLFSWLAFYSDRLNVLLNGQAIPIIEDGELQKDNMQRKRINDRLLLENLRLQGHCDDVESVRHAYYERSGMISVIPRRGTSRGAHQTSEAGAGKQARVLEVKVEAGVQTVRIEVE